MATFVNSRPHAVRLILSDTSERVVGAWGLAVVPATDAAGRPLEVVRSEYLLASTETVFAEEPTPLQPRPARRDRAA